MIVLQLTPEELAAVVRGAVAEALATKPAVEWLSAVQVAAELGMHEKSVRRAVNRKSHPMPAHRFGGAYRFRRDEVERWIRDEPTGPKER